jgi:hypothetical protein
MSCIIVLCNLQFCIIWHKIWSPKIGHLVHQYKAFYKRKVCSEYRTLVNAQQKNIECVWQIWKLLQLKVIFLLKKFLITLKLSLRKRQCKNFRVWYINIQENSFCFLCELSHSADNRTSNQTLIFKCHYKLLSFSKI